MLRRTSRSVRNYLSRLGLHLARKVRTRTGQALVEFALIAPVLFLLVLGGIGLFLYSDASSTVLRAAQAGAETAGTGHTCTTIQNIIDEDINQGLGMNQHNIQEIDINENNTSVVANAPLTPLLTGILGSGGADLGKLLETLENSILSMGTTEWTWSSQKGWGPPIQNNSTVLSQLGNILDSLVGSSGLVPQLLGTSNSAANSPSCQVSLGPLVLPPLLESGTVTVTIKYYYVLPIPLPGIGNHVVIKRSWTAPYGSNALNLGTQ